jgi:WD40 repeat protein
LDDAASVADDADDEPRAELMARVEAALAGLPEPQREAILLHHVRGLSLEEAARESGCPMRTLQSRLARGMAKLREQVTRDGAAPMALVLGALDGGDRSATALLHAARPGAAKLAASVAKGTAVAKGSLLAAAALSLALTAAVAPRLLQTFCAPTTRGVAASARATLTADGVLGRHRRDHVYAVAFAPDGRSVVSGGEGEAMVWDLASRAPSASLAHGTPVRSLAFTPDGARLLTGGADGVARLWDLGRGGDPLALRGHGAAIFRIALSADGATAATGSDDGTIKLWRTDDGRLLRTLLGHQDCLRGLGFAADGALVSGANDRSVRAWAAEATRPTVTEPTSASVTDLAVSPDGTRVAVAAGPEVTLRDARTLAPLARLRADATQALCARFSPDGASVATGGDDGVLRLWGARSGELLAQLPTRREIVCLAFSPDGSRLAIGSWGPEVSLVRVAPSR